MLRRCVASCSVCVLNKACVVQPQDTPASWQLLKFKLSGDTHTHLHTYTHRHTHTHSQSVPLAGVPKIPSNPKCRNLSRFVNNKSGIYKWCEHKIDAITHRLSSQYSSPLLSPFLPFSAPPCHTSCHAVSWQPQDNTWNKSWVGAHNSLPGRATAAATKVSFTLRGRQPCLG